MTQISLQDPLFATYAIAATLMILKAVAMSWLTVARMMQEKGGFRSPEDLRKTPLNPAPDPAQLARATRRRGPDVPSPATVHARMSVITFPATSVSRKSRPL